MTSSLFSPGLRALPRSTRNGGRQTMPRSVPLSFTRAMPTSTTSPSSRASGLPAEFAGDVEGGPVDRLAGVVPDGRVVVLGPVGQGVEADRLARGRPTWDRR